MKTVIAAVALLSAAIASPFVGQDDEYSRKTLVGLNGASVLIEQVRDEAQRDGLGMDQIQTDVELRLRQAGIPVLTQEQTIATVGGAYLYVNINTFKSPDGLYAFNVSIELKQRVKLSRNSSLTAIAATWSAVPVTGTVGAAYLSSVRDKVRDLTDQFINAYLAANPKR